MCLIVLTPDSFLSDSCWASVGLRRVGEAGRCRPLLEACSGTASLSCQSHDHHPDWGCVHVSLCCRLGSVESSIIHMLMVLWYVIKPSKTLQSSVWDQILNTLFILIKIIIRKHINDLLILIHQNLSESIRIYQNIFSIITFEHKCFVKCKIYFFIFFASSSCDFILKEPCLTGLVSCSSLLVLKQLLSRIFPLWCERSGPGVEPESVTRNQTRGKYDSTQTFTEEEIRTGQETAPETHSCSQTFNQNPEQNRTGETFWKTEKETFWMRT